MMDKSLISSSEVKSVVEDDEEITVPNPLSNESLDLPRFILYLRDIL